MLLINPTDTQIAQTGPAGAHVHVDTTCGSIDAVHTSHDGHVTYARGSQLGHWIDGRLYWYPVPGEYGIIYVDGKPAKIALADDEYGLPTHAAPIPAGCGYLLTQYGRPVPSSEPYTTFILNLPHTLDGIPDMFHADV